MSPKSSILYMSIDKTVFLIDIPTSITLGQDLGEQVLLSKQPLTEPFTGSEPNTAEAITKLYEQQVAEAEMYENLVDAALKEIRLRYHGLYCMDRPFCDTELELSESFFTNIVSQGPREDSYFRILAISPIWLPLSMLPSHTNDSENTVTFSIKSPGDSEQQFFLPPGSTFCLTALESIPPTFSDFDFVILDPPWPNRSARRKSSYHTFNRVNDVIDLFEKLQLNRIVRPSGYLAIWITNRPAIRKSLEAWIDKWDLKVVEEWIWIKVTNFGLPVLPLKGIWRKPYEVLLIIQPRPKSSTANHDIKRRVLAGVPDLHSRKPCLKELIELLLDMPKDYTALEIFARHLTTGWHAWGDEVLKYNWTAVWKKKEI